MTAESITDEFLITKEFQTKDAFSQYIETEAVKLRIGCFEVLLEYCNKKDIDASSVSALITSSLKEKLRVEAEDLNLLKRTSGKLPI